MSSCMDCINFNICNVQSKIILEKQTEGNDWKLSNSVEKDCKKFSDRKEILTNMEVDGEQ